MSASAEAAEASEHLADSVLSEVHVGAAASARAGYVVSRFIVAHKDCANSTNLQSVVDKDSDNDGDASPPRKATPAPPRFVLSIRHAMATPLADVGLQVWSAALLLSDWLLHVEKDIAGQHVLELGAGTGLVSCLAACLGANVYCTETGEAVLANCQHNAERNATAFRGHVWVRELDWREVDHPLLKRQQLAGKRPKRSKSKFAWEPADIDSALDNIQTILAADVIYDEDINTALVTVLRRLLSNMRHEARCVLALEKRLCFTIAEMDVTARAYTHFEAICFKHPDFEARRLPLDFPGFLLPHRTPQMVRGGQEQKKHQV